MCFIMLHIILVFTIIRITVSILLIFSINKLDILCRLQASGNEWAAQHTLREKTIYNDKTVGEITTFSLTE